ncbi:hypothetical protein [Aeromicrobium sp. 179-A 4D2 NHS]|uniref:hypothetical protein n=1 Tax=Aeromicrobium sp. 179-A 4D2 NHS TaxID=3142375 RepID=UPI0039A203B5
MAVRDLIRRRDRGGRPNDTRFAALRRGEPGRPLGAPRTVDVVSAALVQYGIEETPEAFTRAWEHHLSGLDEDSQQDFIESVINGSIPPWEVLPKNPDTVAEIETLSDRISANADQQAKVVEAFAVDYAPGGTVDYSGVLHVKDGFERHAHDIEGFYLRAVHTDERVHLSSFGPHWGDSLGKRLMLERINIASGYERTAAERLRLAGMLADPTIDSAAREAARAEYDTIERGRDAAEKADAEIVEIVNYLYERERLVAECTGLLNRLALARWAERWPGPRSTCPAPLADLRAPRWYYLDT